MRSVALFITLGILVGPTLCMTARAEVYLQANFDDKAVGEAIGTGGAELGEPISVSSYITATVQGTPMPTPFLEIQDNDDYSAGSVAFEFLGSEEVTTGFVDIGANLWFPEYEQFFLRVREQGGAAAVFTNLTFSATGSVYCDDENGNVGVIGTYETGRHFPVRVAFNMDQGFYSVWLDGTLVLSMRYHGVVGDGVGRVMFGCTNDADYDGHFYVDDLSVADYPASKHYLRANFNYKTIDAPIGTEGAEVGEPILVGPQLTAIVRDAPMFTPSLEIQDNDDYSAGYVEFEFIREVEVLTGLVVVEVHFWFDVFDDYSMTLREQGGAAQQFTDLYFDPSGVVTIYDAGGPVDGGGTYDVGRVYIVRIIHNLDAGTYRVILDGSEVVTGEPHGVVGHGIGGVHIGCAHDPDYDGLFYVDNIFVSQTTPPRPAACCVDAVCTLALPIDCAFNEGEFHTGTWGCTPDPCIPADVTADTGSMRTVLLPATPNPFAETTVLQYRLGHPGHIEFVVVDAAGRLVRRLLSTEAQVGPGRVGWDRRNDDGARVSPGVYFGRLLTDGEAVSQTVIVLD